MAQSQGGGGQTFLWLIKLCSCSSFIPFYLLCFVLLGMVLALFLYKGTIPRLFQRNILYSQKSKFRTPKAKNVQPKTSSNKLSPQMGFEKKSGEMRQRKAKDVTSKDK